MRGVIMANKKKKVMGTGAAIGKHTSQEESVLSHIIGLVHTQTKAYYIIWRYAPELLPKQDIKTFDDLKNSYKTFTAGITQQTCENWLMEENVQTAVKWLLKRENQKHMIELYNIYFERAKDDTNAFKAFVDFSNQFFADDKKSDILDIVQNIPDEALE